MRCLSAFCLEYLPPSPRLCQSLCHQALPDHTNDTSRHTIRSATLLGSSLQQGDGTAHLNISAAVSNR